MTTTINASTSSGLVNTADTSGILQLQTASTAALTIDASQNTTFAGNTTVSKAQAIQSVTSTTGTNSVYTQYTNTGGSAYVGINNSTGADFGNAAYALQVYHAGAYPIVFSTSNAERMRIDSSGNLLVGTTAVAASSKITVNCPSGNQSVALAFLSNVTRASGTQYGYSFWRDSGGETNAVTFVENGSSGNNAASYVVRTNAATGGGGITNVSGGVALVQGATSWSSYSDLRLKHDVVPITNALESILKIDPIFFKWNDRPEDQPRSIGVSAQSVETVFPELIDRSGVYDVEGGAMQVRYTELIPVLLAAIQELKAINDTQAETINALTARIVALEGV